MMGRALCSATLTNFDGLGYISNVGSLKKSEARVWKNSDTLFVAKSIKNNNQEHCLATEEGAYRMGF